jgi:creatinine amidohydrolase
MLYDSGATSEALRGAALDMAILPIGAVEQHGRHLPVGTDWLIAQALARRVAEQLAIARDVYLLPALPYSLSQCHGPMPGTVWLTPRTLGDVLRDLVGSLVRQGIRRIVVLNAHGGNFVLDDEIRELNLHHPDAIILNASTWAAAGAGASGAAPAATGRVVGGDIHAGASETAAMLAIAPERVQSPQIDHIPPVGREFLDYAFMCQISPHGVWGRPSEAGAAADGVPEEAIEQGVASLDASAARLAEQIEGALAEIEALRGAAS